MTPVSQRTRGDSDHGLGDCFHHSCGDVPADDLDNPVEGNVPPGGPDFDTSHPPIRPGGMDVVGLAMSTATPAAAACVYAMWTLLAIFIPNGIGVILYFILRDPMPSYCSKCGSPAKQGHAFCPGCGAGILPACSQCHRAGQPGWSHCAWCGAKL